MFLTYIPEEYVKPQRSIRNKPELTENSYFNNDVEKLAMFKCPICSEHQLFRGGVYIGCFGCLNYFSEKEIIEANI